MPAIKSVRLYDDALTASPCRKSNIRALGRRGLLRSLSSLPPRTPALRLPLFVDRLRRVPSHRPGVSRYQHRQLGPQLRLAPRLFRHAPPLSVHAVPSAC
jgi:hypothetical protein